MADYVYAGLVKPPSLDDMAYFIHEMGKGAISGLKQLRLLPSGSTMQEDCKIALREAEKFMREDLDPDLQARIPFDYIFLEHTLCKFSRLKVTLATLAQ